MSEVTSRQIGRVCLIRFANEPSGLCDLRMAKDAHAAVADALADDGIGAIVLTGGAPGVFIRHYDVALLVRASEALLAGVAQPADFANAPFVQLTDLITNAEKPVIAAINGVCMGGGFELALACDIRITGADVTTIGLPEVRIGIFPGAGGTQRLPRMIGEARTLDFILRGAVVDAAGALALGLVTEISLDPVARSLELAAQIASRVPRAVALIKHLVRHATDHTLDEGMARERQAFGRLLRDEPETTVRMRRFVEQGLDLSQVP